MHTYKRIGKTPNTLYFILAVYTYVNCTRSGEISCLAIEETVGVPNPFELMRKIHGDTCTLRDGGDNVVEVFRNC